MSKIRSRLFMRLFQTCWRLLGNLSDVVSTFQDLIMSLNFLETFATSQNSFNILKTYRYDSSRLILLMIFETLSHLSRISWSLFKDPIKPVWDSVWSCSIWETFLVSIFLSEWGQYCPHGFGCLFTLEWINRWEGKIIFIPIPVRGPLESKLKSQIRKLKLKSQKSRFCFSMSQRTQAKTENLGFAAILSSRICFFLYKWSYLAPSCVARC